MDWNGGLAEIVPKLVPRRNSNSVRYLECHEIMNYGALDLRLAPSKKTVTFKVKYDQTVSGTTL